MPDELQTLVERRKWSFDANRYANQWAFGVTFIYVGWHYVAIVFDFGPFYIEVRSERVEAEA